MGRSGGWGWSKVLRLDLLRGGVGDSKRLTWGQRGQRQCQLVACGGQHDVIEDGDVFQHVDLRFCV